MPCPQVRDHSNENLKARPSSNNQKTGGSQQQTNLAGGRSVPEPDRGQSQEQPNGVCNALDDLAVSLLKCVQETICRAP